MEILIDIASFYLVSFLFLFVFSADSINSVRRDVLKIKMEANNQLTFLAFVGVTSLDT
jgi:hypothetical protein